MRGKNKLLLQKSEVMFFTKVKFNINAVSEPSLPGMKNVNGWWYYSYNEMPIVNEHIKYPLIDIYDWQQKTNRRIDFIFWPAQTWNCKKCYTWAMLLNF